MEVPRAGVVAEAIPRLRHARGRARATSRERGKALEELAVLVDDARDLRLLEHQLRDENAIRIARPPPWKIARVATDTRREAGAERSCATRGRFEAAWAIQVARRVNAAHESNVAHS